MSPASEVPIDDNRSEEPLILVLALSLVAMLAIPAAATPTRTASPEYDGKELMAGLFFGIGPVSERFPEQRITADPPATFVDAVDGVLSSVDEARPGFTDHFARTMTSGDRPAINAAMNEAQGVIELAIVAEFGDDARALTASGDVQPDCLAFWVAAAITLAAAGNVAYAVNAVRTGNVAWTVNYVWSSTQGERATVEQELWVDKMAIRLAS